MAFGYPVVLDLTDIPVLLVGGGNIASRKAEGLLAAGAMAFIKLRTPVREDAVIGIVFTSFFALGLLLSSAPAADPPRPQASPPPHGSACNAPSQWAARLSQT